jgi:hypothetical protein
VVYEFQKRNVKVPVKFTKAVLSTGTSVQPQSCKAMSLVDKTGIKKEYLITKNNVLYLLKKLR